MHNEIKIRPSGWLLEFLNTQMKGLTGHIEEAGFPYNTVKWNKGETPCNDGNPEWWVYEQVAYHIDGYTRTAILLDDKAAIKRAEDMIYSVLLSPDEDGYLGPRIIKDGENLSRWPHVVFFRACMALYQYNSDQRIIEGMRNHFLNERDGHCAWRDMNNVEIMLWLYGVTGDGRFLEYAESTYKKYNDRHGSDSIDEVSLSKRKPKEHGVSHNEYLKQGAILFSHTGRKEYLDVSVSAFSKMEKFFMLPGGCICSNEHMVDNKYYQTYETCDITDMTWSLSYLYNATNDSAYGDKIERCVFNAGLGSVLDDFRALQYFSGANQVTLGYGSNQNDRGITTDWMRYAPNPGTACCPGNVNRFMPNYIFNMWQSDGKTVVSRLFGPSEVTVKTEDGDVFIREKTAYPFDNSVHYIIDTNTPFTLSIRVPEFVKAMTVAGVKYEKDALAGKSFLDCHVSRSETVTVTFDYETEEKRSAPGVYLTHGPLVFSLPIAETREEVFDKTAGENYPAYNMYPASEWRYALTGNYSFFRGGVKDSLDVTVMPYIIVSARRILNLSPDKSDPLYVKGRRNYKLSDYTFTPRLLNNSRLRLNSDEVSLKLIPYGLCNLRMTVLNKVNK